MVSVYVSKKIDNPSSQIVICVYKQWFKYIERIDSTIKS